MLGLNKTAKC